MNKVLTLVLVLIVTAAAGFYFYNSQNSLKQSSGDSDQSEVSNPVDVMSSPQGETKFANPKKSAHYETNTPAHGAVLAAAPTNIVIDFNFDLAVPSEISIKKDGVEYGVGETLIDTNKLAMRRNFDTKAPDGIYRVTYNACWPDKSCHDGFFEFKIDRTLTSNFDDQTGKDLVEVNMSQIAFKPVNLKVSKGTKITWVNDDEVEHFVNTDSHPAHTYFPDQNSKVLKLGDKYSVNFSESGIYPYHCSAHADSMKASIIVE